MAYLLRISWLSRAFWLIMLLGHIIALGSRLAAPQAPLSSELSTISCLVLANLFFVLKVIDLRCLRMRTDPRSLLTVTIMVAFMHWHSITATIDPLADHCTLPVPEIVVLATVVPLRRLVGGLLLLARKFRRTEMSRLATLHPVWWVQGTLFARRLTPITLPVVGPRPPPSCR